MSWRSEAMSESVTSALVGLGHDVERLQSGFGSGQEGVLILPFELLPRQGALDNGRNIVERRLIPQIPQRLGDEPDEAQEPPPQPPRSGRKQRPRPLQLQR